MIDPVSVPHSIQIDAGLKYKLKIRGRKIVIRPDKTWLDNTLVRINLSRRIRDYQNNLMTKQITEQKLTTLTLGKPTNKNRIIINKNTNNL